MYEAFEKAIKEQKVIDDDGAYIFKSILDKVIVKNKEGKLELKQVFDLLANMDIDYLKGIPEVNEWAIVTPELEQAYPELFV